VTRSGAIIVHSFIHMEPVTDCIDLYMQETILRLQVESVPRHLCVKRMEHSKYSSTHSRYVYWMGLNSQLHPPHAVPNIIPVGQEARWVTLSGWRNPKLMPILGIDPSNVNKIAKT
jgi:hypothetical protein